MLSGLSRARALVARPEFMRRATGGYGHPSLCGQSPPRPGWSTAWPGVSHLSQLALVLTMLSWWQAARVDASAVDQMQEMITRIIDAHAEQLEDTIRRVVQELIDRTTIEETGQELEVR